MSTFLSLKRISKSFATPVLTDVNLEFISGSVHGLVGENGAGKSTLINIICGLLPFDKGEMAIESSAYSPNDANQARYQGISLASQELSLIEELDIAENIFLRELPQKLGFLQKKQIHHKAKVLMAKFGIEDISTTTSVSELSLAQKQLVELCKAISAPCRLLILDEPTAALSQEQSQTLHSVMQELKNNGTSIVYVSHRLNDVISLCDEISVLRDGYIVNTCFANETSPDQLIEAMSKVNDEASNTIFKKDLSEKTIAVDSIEHSNKSVALSVSNITSSKLPYPVNLDARQGEIVGIAGLAGAGKTELLHAIFGVDTIKTGQITASPEDKKIVINSSSSALKAKMGMLSEDRKLAGIFTGQSLAFNASISNLTKVTKALIISKSNIQAYCEQLFANLKVKSNSTRQAIENLSGGNQQKVLLSRWLFADTNIFLLDEPTRGVDVATKRIIYKTLNELALKGACIIVASSELEELFTLSHRLLVMSDRQVVGELSRKEFNAEKVLQLAFSKAAAYEGQQQENNEEN